jgi:MYXO-CTERM domain-containing protein
MRSVSSVGDGDGSAARSGLLLLAIGALLLARRRRGDESEGNGVSAFRVHLFNMHKAPLCSQA